MKKTTSPARRSTKKISSTAKDVDKYIATVPEPARSTLVKMRAIIRSAVPPEATETISYGIPSFRYKGPLICYAAFSNHCSFFPMQSSLVELFKNDLKGFDMSKGTIRFPVDKPMSAALLKKFLKKRIEHNEVKQHRKSR